MFDPKRRENLEQAIFRFLAQYENRFDKTVGITFLTEMIILRLQDTWKEHERQFCGNHVYRASCPIFENVLEHKCKIKWNGHHMAQGLCEAIEKADIK